MILNYSLVYIADKGMTMNQAAAAAIEGKCGSFIFNGTMFNIQISWQTSGEIYRKSQIPTEDKMTFTGPSQ